MNAVVKSKRFPVGYGLISNSEDHRQTYTFVSLLNNVEEESDTKIRRPYQHITASTLRTLNHKNDHVTQQIERSLLKVKEYKLSKKTNKLKYEHQFEAPRSKGMGDMALIIEGLAEQAHESIEIALDSLGDACRDTFVALTGLFIAKRGISDMRAWFKVSVDEILDACGKKRSGGVFTAEARAEVIKHIKTLSQARIEFSMPTTRQVKRGRKMEWEDTQIIVEGPLIVHGGSIGEYSSITGKELWEVQDIALGSWAEFIGGKVYTKLIPQQILAYSPNNEPYHKRIGHYVSELFRNNANRTKGVMPYGITMKAFFEGATIEPSRNRGEFKDDIDKALEHLKQESVIGNYWYMAEKTSPEICEKVAARQGRWFEAYLGMFINFSPPSATLAHYRNIAKSEKDSVIIEKGNS